MEGAHGVRALDREECLNPRRIRFVDAVPRLPNGKVDYPTATELVTD